MRRRPAIGRLAIALAALAGLAAPAALAAFSATTGNPTSSMSAHPDWVAPTVSATAIAKSEGGIASYIRQGGTYHVYANASDAGNPAGGISTITADVSTVTAGQTAASLSTTGGPWTVDGTTYTYRSAQLTADNPLSEGSKSYTTEATDSHGNSRTQSGFSVTVDNTAPTASDVQATNDSGGTEARAEIDDKATLTFSEQMEPSSIVSGWDGTALTMTVRLVDGGLLCPCNDKLRFANAANDTQFPLGEVDLKRANYAGLDRNFTSSTMVQSGAVITITIGGTGQGTTATVADTMTWTPSSTATDRAGNAMSTASANESGASDLEF